MIWPRFAARVIDTLPFAILFSVIARRYVRLEGNERIGSIPVWLVILAFVLPLIYEAGMVAWRGQTVGKMVMHLEVIRYVDGGHVLPYQAVMRAVIFNIASLAGLGLPNVVGVPLQVLGLIIALSVLFDRVFRGLQDKAAGTIVLRTR